MTVLPREEAPPVRFARLRRKFDLVGCVWQSLGEFRTANVLLFFLLVVSALLEGVGLAMLVPLMQLITGQPEGTLFTYILPLLSLFDAKYHAVVAALIVVVLLILKHSVLVLAAGYSTYVVSNMRNMWRHKMMNYYLYAKDRFVYDSKLGVLMENVIQQPSKAAKLIRHLTQLTRELVFAATMIVLLLATSWELTLVIIGLLGGAMLVSHGPLKRYAYNVGRRALKLLQEASDAASENIAGLREIKLFSLEALRLSLFDRLSYRESRLSIWLAVVNELPSLVGATLVAALLVGGIAFMTLVRPDELNASIPLVVLFIFVGSRLNAYATGIVRYSVQIRAAVPSFLLVSEIAAREALEMIEAGETFERLETDIVLAGVSFSYAGEKMVLDNFDMVIPQGKWTVLTGPSGQGKSTVSQLLTGEISPLRGTIEVNGRELSSFSMRSWRRRLGVVSQDAFLFNATVRENIVVASPDASEREIVEAARLANAHDFIVRLERGYDTVVGDRGSKLSVGERQRIAIARAIVGACEFYIFDEATNAQDEESRNVILNTIETLRSRGKTVLMITHQLDAVGGADVVYRLEAAEAARSDAGSRG